MHLFTRANGALFEWLRSPLVYVERGTFAAELRELASQAMNSIALCYHHSHMARGNHRDYSDFSGQGRPDMLDGSRLRDALTVLFRTAIDEAGTGAPRAGPTRASVPRPRVNTLGGTRYGRRHHSVP